MENNKEKKRQEPLKESVLLMSYVRGKQVLKPLQNCHCFFTFLIKLLHIGHKNLSPKFAEMISGWIIVLVWRNGMVRAPRCLKQSLALCSSFWKFTTPTLCARENRLLNLSLIETHWRESCSKWRWNHIIGGPKIEKYEEKKRQELLQETALQKLTTICMTFGKVRCNGKWPFETVERPMFTSSQDF